LLVPSGVALLTEVCPRPLVSIREYCLRSPVVVLGRLMTATPLTWRRGTGLMHRDHCGLQTPLLGQAIVCDRTRRCTTAAASELVLAHTIGADKNAKFSLGAIAQTTAACHYQITIQATGFQLRDSDKHC
jgi:hypothetical protein